MAPSSSQMKLLLVEDSVTNQMIAVHILKPLTQNITIANNGQEAVEYAQKETFDLILMDCHMPEMDGYKATKLIRSHEQANPLPKNLIIALTAGGEEENHTQCLEVGMDDVLLKPINLDDLKKILQQRNITS